MKQWTDSKLLKILVRILGILSGLILLGFAVAGIFLHEDNATKTDILMGFLGGLYYLAIAICLFWPYTMIKNQRFAFWFFRVFLSLSIVFCLSSLGFSPVYVGLLMAIVILGNAWIAYVHYEKLLGSNQ